MNLFHRGGMLAGLLLLSLSGLLMGEPAGGEACYKYSDMESIHTARFIALSLAKRNVLEEFPAFREAVVKVRDPFLRDKVITLLTTRLLKGLKIIREEEDPIKREVCRGVQAEVDPEKLKTLMASAIKAHRYRQGAPATGLPANGVLRIIKVEERNCPNQNENLCLEVVAECVRNTFGQRQPVRIIWYDGQGLPVYSTKERVLCDTARDIRNFWLPMPPSGQTFEIDLPRR